MTDTATFIKVWEGCKLKTYTDSAGIHTIGFGHIGVDVKPDMQISIQRADALLEEDIGKAKSLITQYITVPLNQNQMSAVISLVFNCGVAPLKGSLGHLLNAGDYDTAALQFERWTHAGGKVLGGLVRRRAAEKKLFLTQPTGD